MYFILNCLHSQNDSSQTALLCDSISSRIPDSCSTVQLFPQNLNTPFQKAGEGGVLMRLQHQTQKTQEVHKLARFTRFDLEVI